MFSRISGVHKYFIKYFVFTQINTEASRLRSIARGVLLKEERAALSKSAARDRRTIEGRRIVEKQREQLEKLERRFFQVNTLKSDTNILYAVFSKLHSAIAFTSFSILHP